MPSDERHPFDRLRAALDARGAIRRGSTDQIRATCPAHSDARPSLLVSRAGPTVRFTCFAGCSKRDILRAVELDWHSLLGGARATRERATIVATYDYFDRSGVLLAQKIRLQPKAFRWRRLDPTARGGYRQGLDGARLPPLYGWPELAGASLAFLVEGEKAADRIGSLGLVATCGPAGASWWKASTELLEAVAPDATIAILPDADVPGERHAEQVAADLAAHGRVTVKVVPLPGLPPGGDPFDWIEAGGTREQLLALIASTPLWSPGAAEAQRTKRRQALAKTRKRKERRERREQMTQAEEQRDALPGAAVRDDAVRAALDAALEALQRADGPRSGRELKAALAGQHARNVVDDALRVGRERGALVYAPGPRRALLYSAGILERLPDNHSVTDPAGHSISVPTPETSRDTGIPVSAEQNSVSQCPVTLSRVTQGDSLSSTVQGTLPQPLDLNCHPVTEDRDTRTGTGGRDTRTRDTETQQQAIDENRCCGHDGAELRCQLCRWSSAYSPALRGLRESGRGHFDACDREALAAADATTAEPAGALEPVQRLSEAELEAACAKLRTIPIERFEARDPYRPIDPSAARVDFYDPGYVRGAGRHEEDHS